MIDMHDLTKALFEAVFRAKGMPTPETILKLRQSIHKNIPEWPQVIAFCLCILDDAIRDSDGKISRMDICKQWLAENLED